MPPSQNGYRNGNSWLWPVLVAAAFAAMTGLLQAFWSNVWSNVNTELARVQAQLDQLAKKNELHAADLNQLFVPRPETDEYHRRVDDKIRALNDKIGIEDAATRRARDQVRQIYLSKETFDSNHQFITREMERLNSRIDEMRRDFGSSYTLGDKIKEIQDQLKLLQEQIAQNRVATQRRQTPPPGDGASP